MNKSETKLAVCTAVLYLIVGGAGLALAQTPLGSGFSFQGQLKQGGAPLNNTADLEFTLHDSATLGNQIGGVVAIDNVTVVDGLFTVEVNSGGEFGPDAFNGDARFLEVAVRSPAGSGVFTPLDPRQPLTATPYALQTRGIFVNDAGHVGIGTTTPQHQLSIGEPTADGQVITARSYSTGGVNWNGAAAFGGDTGSVIAGELNGTPTIGGHNADLSAWADLAINPGGGNVGIGTAAPVAPLHVVSAGGSGTITAHNTITAGVARAVWGLSDSTSGQGVLGQATAQSGQTFGVRGVNASTGGTGVFGFASATSGQNVGVAGRNASTGGRGVLGWATATSGSPIGVWGMSDSPSGFDFWASGVGTDYGSASSRRWKSDIRNIDHPLDKIARLRGVYYDWDKEHGGKHDLGMIAEEVGAVLPEIVQYEENGIDAIGMDYSKMTPLLVEAVNALRGQVQYKDSQITELQARLAALETIVDRLTVNRNGGAE